MTKCRRNLASLFIFPALFLFAFSSAAFAVNLTEYKKKIHQAKQSLDVLLYSDEETTNEAENLKNKRDTLAQIRSNFSAVETVEWKGGSVEANNEWMLKRLRAYEDEKDSTKRKNILNAISERLSAIEAKVDELERAASKGLTKDENKQKLADILRRAEYQKPEVKENFIQQKWREFKEWLNKNFPSSGISEPSPNSFKSFSYVLQIVVLAVVLGIIGFLIYRFAPFLSERFRKRVKKDKGKRVILGEELEADETSHDLFSEAEKLAREGNLRAAIRKGYIAFLCELSDRKLIGLAQHKTNRDYLRDVRNRAELQQDMRGLTGSFERHWYGLATTDETDWEEFRQSYQQAINKAR